LAFTVLYRQELEEYDFGPGHPFRGNRYQTFPHFMKQHLSDDDYRVIAAQPATDTDLLLICERDYIDFSRGYFRAASAGLSYPGQFFQFHSADNRPLGKPGKVEEAARLIIGQAKLACDLVQEGEHRKVISIGGGMHHAKPAYGEGFCIYNDVAFCGRYLMKEYGLERILILDTDAHAGNGTSQYFYEDPRVLLIDLHQDPWSLYPGTGFAQQIGDGEGRGYTINIPLPVYAGYDSYRLAFESIVQPVCREFNPQIIVRNGGSDPYFADGLTRLGLPVKGFRMIGEKVREMAEICEGRVIDLTASGYNEEILPWAWLAQITGLAGVEIEVKEPLPVPGEFETDQSFSETEGVIGEVKGLLKDHWKCLV